MSQSGFTPIQLYYSTTAAAAPSAGNLANGELALNITDGRLFYKDNGGVVQVLATKGAGTIGGSNTQVQYNSSGALAGSANLTFDGTTLTAAGLAGPHNGTVGATTPNTGAFTTLAASGTVTFSAGTANGVAYLNGSKVLTSGGTLTFDGTTLTSSAFSGSGAALTSLNASNLASGTVATARLASGTASSSTYLRGDQTWASIPSSTPGGSNTQVQYNNSGSFGGSANLTFDGTTLTAANTINVPNTFGFKNRIINGDMRIDQRNGGASVTASAAGTYYAVDRTLFFKDNSAAFTLQQSTVAPAGFNKSLIVTVTTAASSTAAQAVIVQQSIEGFNTADLGWGAAGAQSVTVSFFVRSSLTGTYCVAFRNSAFNRSYVAEYTISAANTWEYKTITIPGDTSGTWVADNGAGIRVAFDLGSGSSSTGTGGSWTSTANIRTSNQANFTNTNGATFYITGVQLEKGSTATPFDYRPYGTELALCQRYYEYSATSVGGSNAIFSSQVINGNTYYMGWTFSVQKRAAPTVTLTNQTAANFSTTTIVNATTITGFWESRVATASLQGFFASSYTASAEL